MFIRRSAGEPVPVNGDGEQSRDFTYVGNVVDATPRRRHRRRQRRDSTSRPARRPRSTRSPTPSARSSASPCSASIAAPPGRHPRLRRPVEAGSARLRAGVDLSVASAARSSSSLTEPVESTQPIKISASSRDSTSAGLRPWPISGNRERGYDTTLVAGMLTHGEEWMASVAQQREVIIETLDDLHRNIAPFRDARAIVRLARLIRRERPAILHTHTAKAGAVGRLAALLAGDARPPIVVHTFHGHVLRGHFSPVIAIGFRILARVLARTTTVLVAVSPRCATTLSRPVSPWRRRSRRPPRDRGRRREGPRPAPRDATAARHRA